MKKSLLCFFTLFILFSGCSKPEANEEVQPKSTYYLERKQTSVTFPNGNSVNIDLQYHYNGQNQLVGITGINPNTPDPVNIVLSYDEQNRLVHLQNTPSLSWTYTYNDKNQLEKQLRTSRKPDGTSDLHYYYNVYNDGNQLVTSQVFNSNNSQGLPSIIYRYTYAAGQVSRIQAIQPDGEIYRDFTYSYDDKKTPQSALALLSVPRYVHQDLPGVGLSASNVKTHTLLDEKGQRYAIYCYTAKYQYNEAGFPTKSTKLFEDGSVENTVYTYTVK